MDEFEAYDAYAAAIKAGERAHVLTIGSPERTALRVTMGRLDRNGRFHDWQPDAFIIWRGCRLEPGYDLGKLRERAALKVAWLLPRWLVRWAGIRMGAHATTGEYGDTVVPELTFLDALQRWDEPRATPIDPGLAHG